MKCPHTIDIAAYVLDALESPETDWMRKHLFECPVCIVNYDELQGLPALLRTLTMADVEDIVAPAELPQELCETLVGRVSDRRRRRTRNWLLVVSAAALLVAGLVAGDVVPSPLPSVAASATVFATAPDASVTLAAHSWGTQIRLRLSGVGWPERCMLVVSARDGRQDTAATWVAGYRGALDIAGATAIPPAQISRLDVVTPSGRRLVTLPPPAWPH
jgi:hypothetical protein